MESDRLIISGGQTGADRGGLDAAIELGIPHSGWCPKGRRAEDGRIPDKYRLLETDDCGYVTRTEYNVCDADVTILFIASFDRISPGTAMTRVFCTTHQCPNIMVFRSNGDETCALRLTSFLAKHKPKIINVAGSRESKSPGIQDWVKNLLVETLCE